jgi:lysophospholipase L1-like esterase
MLDQRLRRFLAGLALCVPGLLLAAEAPPWVGSWSASPQPAFSGKPVPFADQSLRLILRTSLAGQRLRIKLSNRYGEQPLVLGAARIGLRAEGAAIQPGSERPLSFAGQPGATVPAHGEVWSDAVDLAVPALTDLALSLYLPQPTLASTSHLLAMQTSYVAAGDQTTAPTWPDAKPLDSWPFVVGLDVVPPAGVRAQALVVFGDSSVDGDGSSENGNGRFTDALAQRLHGRGWSVLNQGLIGNRLLRDAPRQPSNPAGAALGEAATARFERDVLQQSGVRAVLLRMGTNDIAFPGSFARPEAPVSVAALIRGYRALAARARQQGLKVIASTIPPFEHADIAPGYASPAKDAQRHAFNRWLRGHAREFDAMVDVDAVLRDPRRPARLLPAYDSGDHLHPNDAGYAAMAAAVPLALFVND